MNSSLYMIVDLIFRLATLLFFSAIPTSGVRG